MIVTGVVVLARPLETPISQVSTEVSTVHYLEFEAFRLPLGGKQSAARKVAASWNLGPGGAPAAVLPKVPERPQKLGRITASHSHLLVAREDPRPVNLANRISRPHISRKVASEKDIRRADGVEKVLDGPIVVDERVHVHPSYQIPRRR